MLVLEKNIREDSTYDRSLLNGSSIFEIPPIGSDFRQGIWQSGGDLAHITEEAFFLGVVISIIPDFLRLFGGDFLGTKVVFSSGTTSFLKNGCAFLFLCDLGGRISSSLAESGATKPERSVKDSSSSGKDKHASDSLEANLL